MQVNVFFWFDVEDYITPESDLALGRLIELFDRHGLKGTFKLVGEKVRGLRQRGHYDILAKLRTHDIGYHTDFHSKPPSISEYLLHQDWESGIQEFVRREQEGFDTLKNAFQRTPSCYGQPGGAWAPQVYPALRQWGVPLYLDAGPWIKLEGRPHWYCGVLDMLGLDALMHMGISGGPDTVARCQANLADLVEKARHTGGEVSLYAHECEFVTRGFWDTFNYARGQDTPRELWQPAPLISESESEARYQAMDGLLAFAKALPEVRVVTAVEAPVLYPDRARGRTFTAQQVVRLCASMADRVTHQPCDGVWLSPAEVFCLAVSLIAARVRDDKWPTHVPYRYVDGPQDLPAVETVSAAFSLDDIYGTSLFEDAYLDLYRHLPAQVQIGRNWLSPADFLATVGAALPRWFAGNDGDAPLVCGDLAQTSYIPEHVSWDWVIFPLDFDADALLQLARLQAWTLKPAR
jgi:hypothetical protein